MSWRVAFRLGRREVARRPGRSALVALLVAVPVCGMTVAAVLLHTDTLSAEEVFRRDNGEVDAVVDTLPVDGDTLPEGTELPEGSDVRAVHGAWNINLEGPDATRRDVFVSDRPLEGRFAGGHKLVEGKAPTSAGEVALTRQASQKAGAGLGDEVTLVREHDPDEGLASGQPLSVVGLIEDPSCLDCEAAVVRPDEAVAGIQPDSSHVVVLPEDVDAEELLPLVEATEAFVSFRPDFIRDVTSEGPFPPELSMYAQAGYSNDRSANVKWALVMGAVTLTAAGIVISAAFAVGARRQLTTMGLLSATGASPKLLRRTMALQGTVSGALGVALGWLLTALVLVLGHRQLETWMNQRLQSWDIRAADLAAIAVLGVLAATIAALMPARTAVRVPTLAALAGRSPLRPVPRWLTVSGLLTIAGGLGLVAVASLGAQTHRYRTEFTYVIILGGVLQLLGACAVTPAIAGVLEPVAGRLRGSGRLAARSLSRHRTRTGAVITAVAAVAALAVFSGGLVRGADEREAAPYPYDIAFAYTYQSTDDESVYGREDPLGTTLPPAALLATIDEHVPGSETLTVRQAVQDASDSAEGEWRVGNWLAGDPVIADEAVLDALDAPASLRRLLERDGLVDVNAGDWRYADANDWSDGDPLTVTAPDGTEQAAAASETSLLPYELSHLLITPELADDLGLVAKDTARIIHAPENLTESQADALWGEFDSQSQGESRHVVDYELQPPVSPLQVEALLAGLAFLAALFVIATSLALAAAESRDEREVLTVVGTRPRDLARSAGAKAAILAGLGAAVAVPLGLAPLAVTSWTWDVPFRPPWPSLVLLVLVAPVVAALAATTASAIAQRSRPVRVSTATFE